MIFDVAMLHRAHMNSQECGISLNTLLTQVRVSPNSYEGKHYPTVVRFSQCSKLLFHSLSSTVNPSTNPLQPHTHPTDYHTVPRQRLFERVAASIDNILCYCLSYGRLLQGMYSNVTLKFDFQTNVVSVVVGARLSL